MTSRQNSKSIGFGLAAVLLLVLLGHGRGLAETGLYEPQKDDFACPPQQEAYGKGDCNVYFKWIQAFYKGNFTVRGWTDYVTRLLSRVTPEVRPGLVVKANLVGRIIAAEWSKENAYRHIHSRPDQGYPNLQNLVGRFDETILNEIGNGRAAEQLLDTAQRVAEKAVRGDHLTDDEKVWR